MDRCLLLVAKDANSKAKHGRKVMIINKETRNCFDRLQTESFHNFQRKMEMQVGEKSRPEGVDEEKKERSLAP